MINPWLFDICRRIDPDAGVVSEGEAASYGIPPKKAGYVGKDAYPTVDHWGEAYHLNCPFCGDTRKRLYFCHLAGAKVKIPDRKSLVSFSPFVCICHNEHCNHEHPDFAKWIKSLNLTGGPPLDLTKAYTPKKLEGFSFLFASEEDKLPDPCYPLTSKEVPDSVLEYLDNRAFDPYTLQAEYGVGYSPDGAIYERMTEAEYKEAVESAQRSGRSTDEIKQKGQLWGARIVVPVIQGRRLIGWQGRTPYQPQKGYEPKYFTSPRLDKSKCLFNWDRALLGNMVVLVEGVFDAFRVGAPALAVFGKTLSQYQLSILKFGFSQNGGCLVMMDPEAPDETYKMATLLHEQEVFPRGVVPVYLQNPGPDPAECSAQYLNELLTSHSEQLLKMTAAGERKGFSAKDLLAGFEILDEIEEE